MPRTYCVTYDIITPESAEDGDVSEHGFCDGGSASRQIPLPDGLCGDAVKTWAANFDFNVEVTPDEHEDYADPGVPEPHQYRADLSRFATAFRGEFSPMWSPYWDVQLIYWDEHFRYWRVVGCGDDVWFKQSARLRHAPTAGELWRRRKKWRDSTTAWRNAQRVSSLGLTLPISASEACARAMAKILLDAGATDPSGSRHSTGDWYTAVDADQDFRTGATTSYSYHLHGWTPDEERMIAALVKARNANAVLLP